MGRDVPPETQFEDVSDEELFEAIEILDEKIMRSGKGFYLVSWQGDDPATGKPWEPTWEPKNACTDELIKEWKERKRKDPGLLGRWTREHEAKKNEDKRGAAGAKRKRGGSGGQTGRSASPKKARTSPKRHGSVASSAGPAVPVSVEEVSVTDPSEGAKKKGRSKSPAKPARTSSLAAEKLKGGDASAPPSPSGSTRTTPRRAAKYEGGQSIEESAVVEGAASPVNQSSAVVAENEDRQAEEGFDIEESPFGIPAEVVRDPAGQVDVVGEAASAFRDVSDAAEVIVAVDDDADGYGTPSNPPESTGEPTKGSAERQAEIKGSVQNGSRPLSKGKKVIIALEPPSLPGAKGEFLGPVPQLSSSAFQKVPSDSQTDSVDSQADKSIPISQLDPISQFSSPPSSGVPARRGGLDVPTPSTQQKQSEDVDVAEVQGSPTQAMAAEAEVAMSGELEQPDVGATLADVSQPEQAQNTSSDPSSESARPTNILLDEIESLQSQLAEVRGKLETAKIDLSRVPKAKGGSALSANLALEKDVRIAQLSKEIARLSKAQTDVRDAAAVEKTRLQAKLAEERAQTELVLVELGQRDQTIQELEQQLKLAKKTSAETSQNKETSDAESAALVEKIESLKADLASSRETENFLRAQYERASRAAVAEVDRGNRLEKQVRMLKEQLEVGLKQRSMHYEAIHKKREEENAKLRLQTKILLDQARLTDDVVRKKAALYDKVKRENERTKMLLGRWEAKYDALQARNEELAEQNTILRARQMGALEGLDGEEADHSDFSEGDAEDDLTDPEGSPVPLANRTTQATLGKKSTNRVMEESLGLSASQIMPGESQFVGDALPSGAGRAESARTEQDGAKGEAETLEDGGSGYMCKWNDGVGTCTFMFDTRTGLAEHVRDHTWTGQEGEMDRQAS